MAMPPSWGAVRWDRAPWKEPKGVRAAATMYTGSKAGVLEGVGPSEAEFVENIWVEDGF